MVVSYWSTKGAKMVDHVKQICLMMVDMLHMRS